MTMPPEGQPALRFLLLDLIYPAVLGSMVVLIFVRVAIHGVETFSNPTSFFGILIAVYYCIGYINIKLLPGRLYTKLAAAMDFLNSIAIFISFYCLGFVSEQMPVHFEGSWRQTLLYAMLIYMFLAPIIMRIFVWENFRVRATRNYLAIAAIAASSLGLLSSLNLFPTIVTASIVCIALYAILIIYFIGLAKYGFADVGSIRERDAARSTNK